MYHLVIMPTKRDLENKTINNVVMYQTAPQYDVGQTVKFRNLSIYLQIYLFIYQSPNITIYLPVILHL